MKAFRAALGRAYEAVLMHGLSEQTRAEWAFHRLHCREDRCVFGCSCWCHGEEAGGRG